MPTYNIKRNGWKNLHKNTRSTGSCYEKGWLDRVITTNLNYRIPELLERPYYVEANMSKYLASIIDIINHDVSVEKVRSSNEKIMSLMEKVNSR